MKPRKYIVYYVDFSDLAYPGITAYFKESLKLNTDEFRSFREAKQRLVEFAKDRRNHWNDQVKLFRKFRRDDVNDKTKGKPE